MTGTDSLCCTDSIIASPVCYVRKESVIPACCKLHILTGYVGLIQYHTAVAIAGWSTVEGTMRVLCSYCMRGSSCYSRCRVPSKVFLSRNSLSGTALNETYVGIWLCISGGIITNLHFYLILYDHSEGWKRYQSTSILGKRFPTYLACFYCIPVCLWPSTPVRPKVCVL